MNNKATFMRLAGIINGKIENFLNFFKILIKGSRAKMANQ